jgi:hypothetical protein
MAAKKKEVAALTKMIQEKLERQAALKVSTAEMKNDLGDTAEAIEADKKFLANLEANCAAKEKEWAVRSATRAEELVALADTIKVLNDDDALELFKKTLPSASFIQIDVSQESTRERALTILKSARKSKSPKLDFIALALRGKKVGFEKVIAMIDEMVVTLQKEQVDDDNKKEYCTVQFDEADDKKKEMAAKNAAYKRKAAEEKEAKDAKKRREAAADDYRLRTQKDASQAASQASSETDDSDLPPLPPLTWRRSRRW